LVSEVVARGFREAWSGGCSSRGPTTQSFAADDRDELCLQDQCLGLGAGERSAPPIYDDDSDDNGGLDVFGSDSGFGSDSDGGAAPAATTSA
jgi:hypothetical protein